MSDICVSWYYLARTTWKQAFEWNANFIKFHDIIVRYLILHVKFICDIMSHYGFIHSDYNRNTPCIVYWFSTDINKLFYKVPINDWCCCCIVVVVGTAGWNIRIAKHVGNYNFANLAKVIKITWLCTSHRAQGSMRSNVACNLSTLLSANILFKIW